MAISSKAFFFTAVAGVGLAAVLSRDPVETFPISALVDPGSVANLASDLASPSDDEFIMNAWQYVGDNFPYEDVGSDMTFEDGVIRCARCLLPTETIKHGAGNCVAVSALLTSILRNRISSDRVFMVVGNYERVTGTKGHAWVECQRSNGEWYLLEATAKPGGWFTTESQEGLYVPSAYINDSFFQCNNPALCAAAIQGIGLSFG